MIKSSGKELVNKSQLGYKESFVKGLGLVLVLDVSVSLEKYTGPWLAWP